MFANAILCRGMGVCSNAAANKLISNDCSLGSPLNRRRSFLPFLELHLRYTVQLDRLSDHRSFPLLVLLGSPVFQ